VNEDRSRSDATVSIEIPAEVRYVALVRVAAVGIAMDLDPVMDDIEDLRVAVNELVGLLIEAADGGHVHLRLWCDRRTVHVDGRCTDDAGTVVPDELTRRILDATVDGYEIADGAFRMHKLMSAV